MNIFAIIQDIDDFIAIQDPGRFFRHEEQLRAGWTEMNCSYTIEDVWELLADRFCMSTVQYVLVIG